ncbi:hypothetical protein Goari_014494, partial [Gossypium aridum]|nr:hypothetical protein [Gossypium aridum]
PNHATTAVAAINTFPCPQSKSPHSLADFSWLAYVSKA